MPTINLTRTQAAQALTRTLRDDWAHNFPDLDITSILCNIDPLYPAHAAITAINNTRPDQPPLTLHPDHTTDGHPGGATLQTATPARLNPDGQTRTIHAPGHLTLDQLRPTTPTLPSWIDLLQHLAHQANPTLHWLDTLTT